MDVLNNPVIILTICIGIPFLGIGIYLLRGVIGSHIMVIQSKSWKKTKGRILVSGVHIQQDYLSSGHMAVSFFPYTEYEYTVSGKLYKGSRIFFGKNVGFGDKSKSEKLVENYKPNTDVVVWYDPRNSENSVLTRKAATSIYFFLSLGIIFLSFVFFFILLILI